ncbi:MAG: hypothetical protein L0Y66_26670 [Myxococcaceae bacterium]|nr:hypothetical protein [Myxococcaceae bacterium]MCI0671000.1 hypothetical protein [Myxococcaceae bacterium]
MPADHIFDVPDELDLIEFFGVDPVERAPEDGYWCFEVSDERGIKLRFSFNIFERSVQTELSVMDAVINTVSHELADRLHVNGAELRATFTSADSRTLLAVTVTPAIQVRWSTLRSR